LIRYRCCTSTESFESDAVVYRCPDCGDKGQSQQSCGCDCSHQAGGFQPGNLLVELDYEGLRQSLDPKAPLDPFALLPQEYPVRECHRQFPAGDTPVSKLEGLASEGVFSEVYAKQDYRNPSGSLKDRASLLVAAQAKYHGTTKVVLASTGNAGSAMSCAGAALGLEIILFVPASAPKEKLAQSLYYGAKVIPVDGTYDDAFALSIAYSQRFGGINRNTAYNPMTLEGKKTVALELYNQFEGRLPELIYVPVGDGVIYSGLCKGLEDLQRLGLIETLPAASWFRLKAATPSLRVSPKAKSCPWQAPRL
jgi:threonine synthase